MRAFAQSIVETIRHPLLVLDDALRVRQANPAFYRTFRVSEAETSGRLIFELAEGEWDIPRLRTLLNEVSPDKDRFEEVEIKHDFAGLGRRIMRFDIHRVLHDDSTPMILLSLEDVTERAQDRENLQRLNRELEDRVRERTAQLEASNKELEAFCYSVSHDLRAPLRGLDGFSDELLRSYPGRVLDDKGKHYLQRMRSGTQRMGQLIDDLLQLSKLTREEMKRELVDLSAIASAVAGDLLQREPGRKVTFEIEPGLSAVGDQGLLKVALGNLLGNAWKFTSKQPAATVEVGRAQYRGSPAFYVKDDGAGFDMAHGSKLFGAFQRLHSEREFPGTGIGLATVQRVVHRLGGQIWAEGAPGKGATFYFTLPLKEAP